MTPFLDDRIFFLLRYAGSRERNDAFVFPAIVSPHKSLKDISYKNFIKTFLYSSRIPKMTEKGENKAVCAFSQLNKTGIREIMGNTRLKPLIPTLREKNRYIAFEIVSKGRIEDITPVSREIWRQTLQLIGETEAARAGLWVLPETWNKTLQQGIIKVTPAYVQLLKASLALITIIDNKEVIVRTTRVSGILRKTSEQQSRQQQYQNHKTKTTITKHKAG